MNKKEEEKRILLQMNMFGPFLKKEDLKDIKGDQITVNALEIFFNRPFSTLDKKILNRYCEITTEDTHLSITPADKDIVEKIVLPLILAKRHYCLGEYLSCIAISGLIGEMLAILVRKMTEIRIHGAEISPEQEKIIFGNKFEGTLGQERRVKILREIKAIDDDYYQKIYEVSRIRNNYLHSWERNAKQAKGDAKKVAKRVFELFKATTNIDIVIENGHQKISVNPKLLKLLKDE